MGSCFLKPPRTRSAFTGFADACRFQCRLDIVGIDRGLSVEGHQDVPHQHTRCGGRPAGLHRQNDEASLVIGQRHRLQPHAQIAARDPSASEDFLQHPVDGGSRNGQAGQSRKSRRGDPDGGSGGVDHQTTRRSRVHGEIETDITIEPPAAPRAPGATHGADNPQRGVDSRILGTADGERQIAGLDLLREWRCRIARRFRNPQDRQIGAGVASRHGSGAAGAIGQRDGDLLLAADGVLGSDNHARTPDDAARRKTRPCMYCHHRTAGPFDCRGQVIR